jgi:hypothetical protein
MQIIVYDFGVDTDNGVLFPGDQWSPATRASEAPCAHFACVAARAIASGSMICLGGEPNVQWFMPAHLCDLAADATELRRWPLGSANWFKQSVQSSARSTPINGSGLPQATSTAQSHAC